MKHLIVGSGVVGVATGVWLNANKEDVIFCDINQEVLKKLENRGFKVTKSLKDVKADIYWICTAEWDTENVLKQLIRIHKNPTIVIRSTMPPGSTEKLSNKLKIKHIAHIPEFLKQKTAIADIFDKDRVVIGTSDQYTKLKLEEIFKAVIVPVIYTDSTTSEIIKYASNCWLAMQISYWNEIKQICDDLKINPQQVADVATLDRRISKYGTAMLGDPFGGFCFPKDINSLIKAFEEIGLNPVMLKAIKEKNEIIKKQKSH